MKIHTAFFTILASVTVCHLQAVNITGVVKDNAGSGLEGVRVRLGKADLATATGSDGSFTLKDNTSLKYRSHRTHPRNDHLLLLKGDRLLWGGREQSSITVSVYDQPRQDP